MLLIFYCRKFRKGHLFLKIYFWNIWQRFFIINISIYSYDRCTYGIIISPCALFLSIISKIARGTEKCIRHEIYFSLACTNFVRNASQKKSHQVAIELRAEAPTYFRVKCQFLSKSKKQLELDYKCNKSV
jgi:hypothetical protein